MRLKRKMKDILDEAKKRKLTQPIKNKMNKQISMLMKKTYFGKIPLQDLFNILEDYGIVPIQEDGTYWSGMLVGGVKNTEQVYFDLAWADSKDGERYTEEIPNANLVVSYYKMPQSGRYEVISYIS